MGSARNRSWSFSRQKLFQSCPRAFLFQYFPWGEPEQDILWFLKRVKTVPLLVGDIVHETISLALRQFKASHCVAKDLHVLAAVQYEARLKSSHKVAEVVRGGRKAPGKGTVLSHHLISGTPSSIEDAGRETLEASLREFEASEAWKFLQGTWTQNWLPITTEPDDLPYFEASEGLGFRRAFGLRVYAPYDLALANKGEFILVDWKSGKKTSSAEAQAERQLAAYALWALSQRRARRTIRVQPYFLLAGEPWSPSVVTNNDLDEVVRGIEEHDWAERTLLEVKTDSFGDVVSYEAKKEDFPPKPKPGMCAGCKFLTVCEEGKKMVTVV